MSRESRLIAGILLVVLPTVMFGGVSILSLLIGTSGIPGSAILIPAAFFLSVLRPDATQPNAIINLAYAGAILLAVSVVTLGIGLIRSTNS